MVRALILETSQRLGQVALAEDDRVLAERCLDESRRHARDLAPSVRELLAEQGWRPRDLDVVIVSRGPGSYTGLRVGLMSAKTLAYATGCALIAVDTFAALARQVPASMSLAAVIADAQQERVYAQTYRRAGEVWEPVAALAILPLPVWLETLPPEACVVGPGLEGFGARLPEQVCRAQGEACYPRAASLLAVGLRRHRAGERDDPFAVEPLYLRPSSAEEKWKELGR